MRRIIQDKKSFCFRGLANHIMISGLAKQIHWYDPPGFQPKLPGKHDALLKRTNIDIERFFIDIDEDRCGAPQRHDFTCGSERK